jgi:hypothetical protein
MHWGIELIGFSRFRTGFPAVAGSRSQLENIKFIYLRGKGCGVFLQPGDCKVDPPLPAE